MGKRKSIGKKKKIIVEDEVEEEEINVEDEIIEKEKKGKNENKKNKNKKNKNNKNMKKKKSEINSSEEEEEEEEEGEDEVDFNINNYDINNMERVEMLSDDGEGMELNGQAAVEQEQEEEEEELKEYKNDVMGLMKAKKDIAMNKGEEVPWIERLDITSDVPFQIKDVHDDLDREAKIHDATLINVHKALQKLDDLGVPHRRPDDYFAEMIKSDEHMQRIRKKLVVEQQRLKQIEDRRKQREMKKFGKQMQANVLQERAKKKRMDDEKIKQWRKGHKNGEDMLFDDMPEDVNDSVKERKKGLKRSGGAVSRTPNQKRQRKTEKYGGGGRTNKKMKEWN